MVFKLQMCQLFLQGKSALTELHWILSLLTCTCSASYFPDQILLDIKCFACGGAIFSFSTFLTTSRVKTMQTFSFTARQVGKELADSKH